MENIYRINGGYVRLRGNNIPSNTRIANLSNFLARELNKDSNIRAWDFSGCDSILGNITNMYDCLDNIKWHFWREDKANAISYSLTDSGFCLKIGKYSIEAYTNNDWNKCNFKFNNKEYSIDSFESLKQEAYNIITL